MAQISVLTAVHADTPEKVGWLEEAVQSVVDQSFFDWELILVDDASPQDVGFINEKFNDRRVRSVRTSHQFGPAMARNTAAALAESECFIVLDGDDRFASPSVLETLFSNWRDDLVVYGDMQLMEAPDYNPGRIIRFPPYDFVKTLDPKGLIPVTAMHSKACHLAAGGWKPEIEAGLEDVEYWIAAGEQGFCGLRIDETVLLYRKHNASRTAKMRAVPGNESAARKLIYEMHRDVYEGRYPTMCCGGGAARSTSGPVPRPMAPPPPASSFRADETILVRYTGKRQGDFHIQGQTTRTLYHVQGPGYVFPVHVNDAQMLRRVGRGMDFAVGVAPPPVPTDPPAPAAPAPEPQIPQLAEIVRMPDEVVRGVDEVRGQPSMSDLDRYELGKYGQALEVDGWSVERLSRAQVGELTAYRGIGLVTAARLIASAKEIVG